MLMFPLPDRTPLRECRTFYHVSVRLVLADTEKSSLPASLHPGGALIQLCERVSRGCPPALGDIWLHTRRQSRRLGYWTIMLLGWRNRKGIEFLTANI